MLQRDKQLQLLLQSYQPQCRQENDSWIKMLEFIAAGSDVFNRENPMGHFTGSAWLLSPDQQSTLLTHHKKLNMWLQLGGHAENENDILSVSVREAKEESGIDDITIVSQHIFDLDAHLIPAGAAMPEHYHFDIRFLLQAEQKQFIISGESNQLRWFNYPELNDIADQLQPSILRMAKKWQELGSASL